MVDPLTIVQLARQVLQQDLDVAAKLVSDAENTHREAHQALEVRRATHRRIHNQLIEMFRILDAATEDRNLQLRDAGK